jgi:hypothetical protein
MAGRQVIQALHSTVSSISPPKFFYGFEKIVPAKIGPELLCHVDFRVTQLPEQKIRNPHFAGGPNEQIRIRPLMRIQAFGKDFGIDLIDSHPASHDVFNDPFHCIDYLGSATVV